VLEPDRDVRTLLVRSLKLLGHEPLTGEEVVDEIDLVLFEPASPEALAAARALRQAHPDVGGAMCEVYPRDGIPSDFRSAPHLVKPVPLKALEEAVRRALTEAP
jgi:hypothetical protein